MKRVWVNPSIEIQQFMANEYVAATCIADGSTMKVTCTKPKWLLDSDFHLHAGACHDGAELIYSSGTGTWTGTESGGSPISDVSFTANLVLGDNNNVEGTGAWTSINLGYEATGNPYYKHTGNVVINAKVDNHS